MSNPAVACNRPEYLRSADKPSCLSSPEIIRARHSCTFIKTMFKYDMLRQHNLESLLPAFTLLFQFLLPSNKVRTELFDTIIYA